MPADTDRSLARIEVADLLRLAALAADAEAEIFGRNPHASGPSKFGRYPGDPPRYSGRRVDLLGRSLPAVSGADPADAIRRYLAARRTNSAKALAAKAVVLIDPQNRAGEIVWPKGSHAS